MLAEIIKTPELRHIPVVILSTDTRQEDFLYKLGAKALIKKTGDSKMLRTQLELLNNSEFIADWHMTDQTFETGLLASFEAFVQNLLFLRFTYSFLKCMTSLFRRNTIQ